MSTTTAANDAAVGPDGPGGPASRSTAGLPARVLAALLRTDWLWVALLTVCVGGYRAGTPQLWRDEMASWSAATRGTGELLAMLQNVDAVSGAYYLLLHGWISVFGDSPLSMRMPSVLAMAGAAACVVLIGRELFDRRTALMAGLLFASFAPISRYAQEARSYAIVVFAAAAATLLLLRALRERTWWRWLPYALAVSVAGLFHIVSLLLLVPHALLVLLRRRRPWSWQPPLMFLAAVTAALLPLVPLVILGRQQVGRQIGWLHRPALHDIPDIWSLLFAPIWVSRLVPLLGLLALVVRPASRARGRRPAVEIALVAALPFLFDWVLSQGGTSYFSDRYLLFTVPGWAVLIASGLAALRPRLLGVLGLAGTILLSVPYQGVVRRVGSHEWRDTNGAAAIIAAGYRPGDGLVPLRGDSAWLMLDDEMTYDLRHRIDLKDVFTARTAAQSDDLFDVECSDPVACLGSVPRIWVVTITEGAGPYASLPKAEADALAAAYKPTRIETLKGLRVSLLERVG